MKLATNKRQRGCHHETTNQRMWRQLYWSEDEFKLSDRFDLLLDSGTIIRRSNCVVLARRMDRACDNAESVVGWLEGTPEGKRLAHKILSAIHRRAIGWLRQASRATRSERLWPQVMVDFERLMQIVEFHL